MAITKSRAFQVITFAIRTTRSSVRLTPVRWKPGRSRPWLHPSHRALIQAIKAVNLAELVGDKNILTSALDRETRRTVVRVVDRVTNAVVSQIPSRQLLRMAEDLKTNEE